jgi:hypothetical protein
MKKFLLKSLSVFLAIVLLVSQNQIVSAKTIDAGLPSVDESVFELDENALAFAMQDLNELDNYLASNEGVSYTDLAEAGSDLIANVSDNSSPIGMDQEGESPLGIPPFLWGCVLGWVGLLIVYLISDQDKELTKKALIGCLVGTGVWVVVYVVLIAAAATTTTTTYSY